MSYTIKTSNGSTIAIVQDATLDTIHTSLTLVGRDYAGYGTFLNENFVYLLENFASNTEPAHKITGQLWYDTANKILKVYDGTLTDWKPISSTIAQNSQPISAIVGDLWFDTSVNQLNVYAGSTTGWVLIGPPTTTAGVTSGPVVETIQDTSSGSHVIIIFYISNNVIGIMSADDPFTPYTPINGFDIIYPGFNLSTATTSAGGINRYVGSTTNAQTLNGVGASSFLRSDQNTSTAYQLTVGGGLVIGSDLQITANINEVQINNVTNNRDTNFYSNVGGLTRRAIGINGATATVSFSNAVSIGDTLTIDNSLVVSQTTSLLGTTTFNGQLLPSANITISIGSAALNFSGVYAQTLYGNIVAPNLYVNSGTILNNLTVNGNVLIAGNVVATQSYVTAYVQTAGRNSQGQRYISSTAPTGGSNGDIWYQV